MCQESPRPTGPFCFITGERASQVALVVRNPPADAEDIRETDLIPESGRSLEKNMATHSRVLDWRIFMDRGAWWATVHGVAKSWT